MNREQRRAARRAGVPADAITYAQRYRCPDCSADTELQVVDGLPLLNVRHDGTCPRLQKGHPVTTVPTHAVDVYLDSIRLVEALLHDDIGSYNSVVRTTEASASEVVFAMATILAAAAAQHADPDAAIRDLRAAFVNVSTA